ncbi:rhodanese-like domain-containing protein [Persephonella sp.]|uniref:rhodanese-like domain-containing protein n=1 Tax=Persephonella sp. TaxID=2060922 RepID=UPI002610F87B|nr:rhodanese-like domain-containing protein [Persephonella sp.]
MSPKIERAIYIAVIIVLSGVLLAFGKKEVELRNNLPMTVDELADKMSNPKINLQIIDVRPYKPSEEEEDEAEDTDFYTLVHIPGAIPMPDCDLSKTPKDARPQISPYVPTVIVSKNGDPKVFEKCKKFFKFVRNLKGGIVAWDEAGYPEDEDEYTPPSAGGGGGCL